MWAGHRFLRTAGEIKPQSTDTACSPPFLTIPSDRARHVARVSVGGAPNFYNLPRPLCLKLNAVQLVPDNFLAPSVFPWENHLQCLPSGSTGTLCITQGYLVANRRNFLWLTSAGREVSEGKRGKPDNQRASKARVRPVGNWLSSPIDTLSVSWFEFLLSATKVTFTKTLCYTTPSEKLPETFPLGLYRGPNRHLQSPPPPNLLIPREAKTASSRPPSRQPAWILGFVTLQIRCPSPATWQGRRSLLLWKPES